MKRHAVLTCGYSNEIDTSGTLQARAHQGLTPSRLRVARGVAAAIGIALFMPMIPGRFLIPNTEVFGYYEQEKLIAWSMYRIWDDKNIVIDHHAWDYNNPKLRIGLRSLQNECALYRNRGYQFMYFESIEPYMLKLQGFEILGTL